MQVSDRIGRRIKLQDLNILIAVVQAGSMGKAARKLNTSQPNISKSIADLEHALGVRLLDRTAQGVEPTEYGRALLDGGAAVFDELRQTVKTIEFLADPTAGEVRIGCSPGLAPGFATAVIDRFTRRHPLIVCHLTAGLADVLHRELTERNVDFLITRKFGSGVDERLSFELLFEDSYVVAAGAQSPWIRRRRVTLATLADEPWVLAPTGIEAFRGSGLDCPRKTVFSNSSEARMSLLATGRFLAILSTSVLKDFANRAEIKVLPVEVPIAPVPTGVVTLKNRTLSAVARLCIEQAREVAKPLAKKKS
jgi:DNA-binding transcriptional LysR family regulator